MRRLLILGLFLACQSAFSQADKVNIDLSLGARVDAKKTSVVESFYDLKLFGRQFSRGKKFDSVLEPGFTYETIDQSKADEFLGSLPFTLRFNRSSGDLDTGFAEALGNFNPFVRGLREVGLRGAAYFGADEEFRKWKGSLGVETHAYSLIAGKPKPWTTSWLVFGLAYQKREDTDAALLDTEGAIGTYRAFLAHSLVKSENITQEQVKDKLIERLGTIEKAIEVSKAKLVSGGSGWDSLASDFLERMVNNDAIQELKAAYSKVAMDTDLGKAKAAFHLAVNADEPEESILEKAHELAVLLASEQTKSENEANLVKLFVGEGWRDAVQKAIMSLSVSPGFLDELRRARAHPVLTWSAESVGWYDSSKVVTGDRFKQLLSAGFDLYPKPGNFNVLVRFRYESGHDRAADEIRVNRFSLSAAVKF